MRLRYSLTLLVVLALSAFVTAKFYQLTQAENIKPDETQTTTEQPLKTGNTADSTKTKTLTEAQKAIPDEVAFEVFLRTVGENNARQLLVQAGLDEDRDSDKIDQIMNDAKAVNRNLEILDKRAKEIKISKDGGRNFSADDAKVKSELAKLESDRKNILQQVISRNLQEAARFDNGWEKLENYVQTTVKSKMQVVEIRSSLRSKPRKEKTKNVAFAKSFAAKSAAQTQVGNAYLYTDGWTEEENIFGSGLVTEQYASGTSYLVTVTVTSPSGRTNTTSGGWNYAALNNITGLSLGVENGTYNIQANFEADLGGYYDEWGNYYSYGSYSVGTETDLVFVRPLISISAVSPSSIEFNRGTMLAQTGTANISLSADIGNLPRPVYITVELNKQSGSNFYTVTPNLGPNSPPGRLLPRLSHNSPGGFIGAAFSFAPGTLPLTAAEAEEQFRISRVEKRIVNGQNVTFEELDPTTDFQYGTRTKNINISVPASQAGGGGGSCSCGWAGLSCAGCPNYGAYGYTNNGCASGFFNQYGCCCFGSPIVIDVDGNGYAMTNNANGVWFDLGGDGVKDKTSWTAANSDDAWLVLDRNNNNRIDDGKEMFGNYCDQPAPPPGVLRNGFIGLAEFDKAAAGGTGDGMITRSDAVFRRLRLWQDRNHNGIAEPEELSKLPALDIVALDLDYKESNRTDEYGNRFKYRAKVRDARGARAGRWAWDVFTVPPQ